MYPEWDYGITPQVSIWEALSKRYAQGVSGIATYVHPDGYIGEYGSELKSVFLMVMIY